jgi:beta-glucosidase
MDVPQRASAPRPGFTARATTIGLVITTLMLAASDAIPQGTSPAPDWNGTGTFPPGFLFGVATAAHQVEGNNLNNDWAIFEQRPDVANSGEAVNHRDLTVLAQDLDLAKSLGINAYRFSLEWSRIEPAMEAFDEGEIDYYRRVVEMIRARGMEPIVGLFHFTLPQWLLDPADHQHKMGWGFTFPLSLLSPNVPDVRLLLGHPTLHRTFIVERFVRYVDRITAELGSKVNYWTTFNEPNAANLGYVVGIWSPGHGAIAGLPEWSSYMFAVNQMIRAHRDAYQTIKHRWPAARVGIVQHVKRIFPHDNANADERQDARDWDYVLAKQFLDALTPVFDTGLFPVPQYAQPSRSYGFNCWDPYFDYQCGPTTTNESYLDFVGLNYYNAVESVGSIAGVLNPPLGDSGSGGIFNSAILSSSRRGRPANDYPEELFASGPWEIYPEGLLDILRDLWGRYKLPILITENGLAEIGAKACDCKLTKRPAFIVSHLQMVLQAINEGVPILGYLHWALVDNFEWRDGYDTRAKFGLYHVRLNREEVAPLAPYLALGPTSLKELDESVPGYQARTETLGASAFRQIIKANGITQSILNRWGSFPRITGEVVDSANSVAKSEVQSIEIDPFGPLVGQRSFGSAIPESCRILAVDVMYTDNLGNPLEQNFSVVPHQGGRVAYQMTSGLTIANRPLQGLEIVDSHPGTTNGEVVVRWFRESGLARFDFRVFYRLDCSGKSMALACDDSVPLIQCAASDDVWHASDVSIQCTATDASGLDNSNSESFSLSTSVPTGTESALALTETRRVCDAVGNCSTAGPVAGNKVDKRPPMITITAPVAGPYDRSTTLTLSYTVIDGGSGATHERRRLDGASTLGGHELVNGRVLNLLDLALGSHTFTVDAVDAVANSSNASVTFTVIATSEGIKREVKQFLSNGEIARDGLAKSLLRKLESAAIASAGGDCATAADLYKAFIHEVSAHSGKQIDAAAAGTLIAGAEYLIAHLTCPL